MYRYPWVSIDPAAFVDKHVKFKQGRTTFIGWGCHIFGKIKIGEGVLIGPGTIIHSASHPIKAGISVKDQKAFHKRIFIGDNVFIGAGAVILGGNEIKSNAVIGAGSVLPEDHVVGENEVWVGNPAHFLKKRI